MRTLLGTLLVLMLALAGCGEEGGVGQSPAPGTKPAEPQLLTLVSQPDVGGEVDPVAVPIDRLEKSFTDDRMGKAIDRALEKVELPERTVPAAAVVAVGCDAPAEDSVEVEARDVVVEVTAPPVTTDKQCLVPVTTVALVAVPGNSL